MKKIIASSFATLALAAAVFVSPTSAAASSHVADQASQQLQLTGSVPVKSAGPYVEVGTYRIQVTAKLGTPTRRLADGSWLYQDFVVDGSNATGTLLVRFAGGTVSELSLLSPATMTALLDAGKAGATKMKVASAGR